jgi:hypothetical protein
MKKKNEENMFDNAHAYCHHAEVWLMTLASCS